MKRKDVDPSTVEAIVSAIRSGKWEGLAAWMRLNPTGYSRYQLAREIKAAMQVGLEELKPVRGRHPRSIYRARRADGSRASTEETEKARRLLVSMAAAGIARHALADRLKNETGIVFSRGRIENILQQSRLRNEAVEFYQP